MSTPEVRLRVLAGIMLAGLLALTGRLWTLQLTHWSDYALAATGNRTSVTYTVAPRGMILDVKGVVLAQNRPVWNVSVLPARFPGDEGEAEKIIGRLAGILQAPLPDLREDIAKALRTRGAGASPLTDFGLDVKLKAVAQIEENALDLPGIVITESFMRSYPLNIRAAHVLGYARAIKEDQYAVVKSLEFPDLGPDEAAGGVNAALDDPIYAPDAIYGQGGVEKQYEIDLHLAPPLPVLTGRRGRTIYEVDAVGNRVRLIEQRPPAVGATVYLTIDAQVQQVAEEALRTAMGGDVSRTGAAVAVDLNNGDIVALASFPAFDSNDMVGRLSPEKFQALNNDPRDVFLNKVVAGKYPPASTFKIVSATAALEAGRGIPEKRYLCTGAITEGGRRFECWKPGGHGALNLREAIAESCDVYFYELVRDAGLDPDELKQYATMFGFGERSGLDLPEEKTGLVPDRAWKLRNKKDRWWTGDTLNMVIGQGATTATPLQVAMATAALANGGSLLQPRLVRKIVWPSHMGLPPTIFGREVRSQLDVKPETLQLVREGLRLAVTSAHGTGHSAMADLPIKVAGKTGSAEHNRGRPTHAWFTCMAPYDNPRYVVTVLVSEGGHGGSVAAPVARRMLGALFGFERSRPTVAQPVASD